MPTQRFLNLPVEKQERILEAAVNAFAENGINADVASIVRGAEISRGSFYQYFDNINDLYSYVIELIIQIKIKYYKDILDVVGQIPFIDFFKLAFERGLDFAGDHPKYCLIGAHLASPGGDPLGLMEMGKKSAESLYVTLIEADKEKGLIRQDVDSELLAKILHGISSEIAIEKLYREHKGKDEIMGVVDEFLKILTHGIKP